MFLYDSTYAFPNGVAPGFDPTHVAAGVPRASTIAVPGGVFELLHSQVSTPTGTPTDIIQGSIGRARNYGVPLTATNGDAISNLPAVSDTQFTTGSILTFGIGGQSAAFIASGGSTNVGFWFGVNSSNVVTVAYPGGVTTNSSITLSTSNQTPYFVACTVNGTTNAAFVALNLRTGQISTSNATPGGTMLGASTGTYRVGNINGTTQELRASVATTMYSKGYIGMQGLLEWANDPWAFWYPSKNYPVPDFAVGATVVIPNSRGSSLLMMGV